MPSASSAWAITELHAVQLKLPCAQHIARVAARDEEEHLYHCVRELARMVGIEPEGA